METPEPTASASDVTDLVDTSLEPTVINKKLGHAAARNEAVNDTGLMTAYEKARIETLLVAIRILETTDRPAESVNQANASITWLGNPIESLRNELQEIDPSGTLGTSVRRNRSRTTGSRTVGGMSVRAEGAEHWEDDHDDRH